MSGNFQYIIVNVPIEINAGRATVRISVKNTGDRPIQVGSHFHFFETNKALDFDRKKAFGMRLNIPSGTSVRFEPGDEKEVELVQLGGKKGSHGIKRVSEWEYFSKRCDGSSIEKSKRIGFQGCLIPVSLK